MTDVVLPRASDYCKLQVHVYFAHSSVVLSTKDHHRNDENFCSKIYEKLRKSLSELVVIETENPVRRVFPHFTVDLIESRLIWGDFQLYRKVLGMIFVCFLNNDSETLIEQLERTFVEYAKLKEKRKSSLLDCRCCLIFDNPSMASGKKLTFAQDVVNVDSNEILKYYDSRRNFDDILRQLESDVKDYLKNLFWVLEGKRLNLVSYEQLDNPPCPMAPDEEKYFVGIDTTTRTFRKRRLGRLKKQLADSTLLTGLPVQATEIYLTAIDILKSANDFLWLAGAYEGYACACMILKYYSVNRNLHKSNESTGTIQEPGLRRVSTFTLGQQHSPSSNHSGHHKNQSLTDNIDVISAVNLLARNGGHLSPKHSFSSKISGTSANQHNQINRLKIESNDIEEKARLALENYRKFSIAVAIECECVMKSAFLFVEEKRYSALDAFLRENCCVRFLCEDFKNFTDFQKADICLIIANIYKKVKFERKCSFYLRLSSLFRFNVANLNEKQASVEDCRKIYPVLLSSMSSYLLSSRQSKFAHVDNFGWPAVCIRAFHELYVIAQRSQYTEAAIRHLAHFIHTTLEYLSEAMLEQLSNELKTLCRENLHNAHTPLIVTRSITLPPLSLIKFPKVLDFTVCSLSAYLIPKEMDVDDISKIFIYTPLVQSSINKKLLWVVNCAGIVEIKVENLLPIELEVRKLMVHCEGVEYDASPTLMILPPKHVTTAKLIVVPKSSGVLTITGYTCEVMNIRTECRVGDITWLKRKPKKLAKYSTASTNSASSSASSSSHWSSVASSSSSSLLTNRIKVDVIRALPELAVSTSLSRAQNLLLPFDSTEICSAEIQLYSGQKSYQTVQILNKSNLPVHHLSYEIQQPAVSGGSSLVEIIKSREVHNTEDSVVDDLTDFYENPDENSTTTTNPPVLSDFPANLPPKGNFAFKICINAVDPLAAFDQSDPSRQYADDMQIYDKQEIIKSIPYTGRLLVANIKFHYFGGDSTVKYQRTCSLTINVTIVPVVVIVDWNLLPGESANNRYIALDIINACESEIDVEYAENKVAVVQPKDICRIPVLCQCCTYDENDPDLQNLPSIRGPYFKQYLLSFRRKVLQKHLLTQLDIRWKLGSESGAVPLGYLIKSLSLREDLFISPLSAVVDINNDGRNSVTDYTCNVGCVNTLKIKLISSSSSLILNGLLTLHCYQDLQNGTTLKSEQIVFIGSRDLKFHLNEELTVYDGAFQFLFLTEGLYKLELKFSDSKNDISEISPSSDNRRLATIANEKANKNDFSLNLPFCFPLLPIYTFSVT